MRNCVVELYGLDFLSSYQHAFIFVRQLAIRLKHVQDNTTEHKIINWQFFNSVAAWVYILSAYPQQEHLRHLIYPLTMLISGIITLDKVSSTAQLATKFHYIRLLNQLSFTNAVFINAQSYLLEILDHLKFGKKLKNHPIQKIDLDMDLSASAEAVLTKQYHEACAQRTISLLTDFYSIHAYNIAFPELIIPTVFTLKKIAKKSGSPVQGTRISSLLEKLYANADCIKEKRSKETFAPHELTKVDRFLLEEQQNSTAFTSLMRHRTEYKKRLASGDTQQPIIFQDLPKPKPKTPPKPKIPPKPRPQNNKRKRNAPQTRNLPKKRQKHENIRKDEVKDMVLSDSE